MIRRCFYVLLVVAGWATAGWAFAADAAAPRNILEKLAVAASGELVTVRMSFRDPVASVPPGFTTASPARIALDLVAVDSGLDKNSQVVNQAYLRSVHLAQAGDRLRVVLNLDKAAVYEAKIDGRDLFVTLTALKANVIGSESRVVQFSPPPAMAKPAANIRDISFRRGKDGEARVLVDLDDPGVGVDIQKVGANLIVDFSGAHVPDTLVRKLDVNDFATPVTAVTIVRQGDKVRMTVSPRGTWEHIAYQSENQFVLEVRPIVDDPNKLGGGTGRFVGERLSLRFRDYPVKEVLHAFSDFSNFNIVVSEAVSGTVSLNLQDVPWDQALDIILQQKGLAMRKNGNVLMIAPRDELAARAKVLSEAQAFEPAVDAIFQVNYIPAATAKTRIAEYLNFDAAKSTTIKIMAESTANKLFIKAPESSLEEVRRVLREIDIPPRQVLIEARIVEASDTFSKSLGVRLGYTNSNEPSNVLGTNLRGQVTSGNVSLPVSGGTLNFLLTNNSMTKLLAVELSALEADGKGKIVSSPRVLAQNGQTARIEQGTEIPYLQASSSGATSVSFKKAVLSLNVTPTINADGRISMEVAVNKDSPNFGQAQFGQVPIDTKQVTTKVVVDNGGTIVIGGIYVEDASTSEQRIPFLGDLPYIGFLFKTRATQKNRSELLVFITPRIVSDQLSLQ